MTDQPRKRITIETPDGSTILAARHLDATEGRVQIGSTVDTATRSAITQVLGYIAKAHNSPTAPMTDQQEQPAPVDWPAIARQRERELKQVGEARHRAEGERDTARQHAAAIAAQRDRLRQRMNNLADRWDNALAPDKAYARALRAEITCDPFEPTAAMSVRSYRNDQNQERWAFRCWGTDRCDGWLSLDHTSQESAERDRDRHVAEEHGAPAPAATEATDCWTQQVDGTWTLPVGGGTILFTQASTPEERERFAANSAAHQQPKPAPAGLRDQLAAAIWERQNPGRRYTDCEHPWQADAEADADAVLAALTLRLDFGEEQAWCKICRRVWEGRSHQCESDAEQTVTRVRNECDRLEAAVRDNPTAPDFDGAYLTAIRHVRTALQPPKEPTS
ncbi:hypothetical protein ACH40F_08030 [Streptomyces sp. NPDC020794]|uniref:hypothetical protein n=1 Tax=unclassified Streptomyces TaxID=2593676 RepID=UPI0036EC74F8